VRVAAPQRLRWLRLYRLGTASALLCAVVALLMSAASGEPSAQPAESEVPLLAPPSALLRLGARLELGGIFAPQRSQSAADRLPWRPRETHSLYPGRAELSVALEGDRLRGALSGRLSSLPLWADSAQSASNRDPVGLGPALNELWLSYALLTGSTGLSLGGGRWVPELSLITRGAQRPPQRPQGPRPWSLVASERRWSSAPDPRDRAAMGLFMSLEPQRGRLSRSPWLPRASALELFSPSDRGLSPTLERPELYMRGALSWSHRSLESLKLSAAQALSGPQLRWLSAQLRLSTQALGAQASQRARWAYQGRLIYRAGPSAPDPLSDALRADIGGYGRGSALSHSLHFGWRWLDLGARYEWRDPQHDFAYNAQHSLSLICDFVIYDSYGLSLEHRHLWSAQDNRLAFDSDLTFAQLSWTPHWSL